MAEDFVVETTNERGIVEQTRFSANQTVLQLNGRSLVRIDGLERATTLQRLVVRRPKSTHFWCRISHILALSFSWTTIASSTCQRVCSRRAGSEWTGMEWNAEWTAQPKFFGMENGIMVHSFESSIPLINDFSSQKLIEKRTFVQGNLSTSSFLTRLAKEVGEICVLMRAFECTMIFLREILEILNFF
jgi:hypothetical protein